MTAHDDLATLGRLLARCVSADEFSPELERLKAHVATLEQERERDKRKVAAYDAARAVVKIEGNTRTYYVLRAEAAEAALAEERERSADLERNVHDNFVAYENRRKQAENLRAALADPRRALEEIAKGSHLEDHDYTGACDGRCAQKMARRALAASEPTGTTEEPPAWKTANDGVLDLIDRKREEQTGPTEKKPFPDYIAQWKGEETGPTEGQA